MGSVNEGGAEKGDVDGGGAERGLKRTCVAYRGGDLFMSFRLKLDRVAHNSNKNTTTYMLGVFMKKKKSVQRNRKAV